MIRLQLLWLDWPLLPLALAPVAGLLGFAAGWLVGWRSGHAAALTTPPPRIKCEMCQLLPPPTGMACSDCGTVG